VEVNGKQVGVEADGPSHFIGRSKSPPAKKILKMGQVPLTGGLSLYPCRIGVGQTWAQSSEEARLSLGAVGTLRNFTTVGKT